jgi:hypothetical protein
MQQQRKELDYRVCNTAPGQDRNRLLMALSQILDEDDEPDLAAIG